jgi:lipopolysaccharide/colanic/teichoic acid biosynthesis glycosyltransferase
MSVDSKILTTHWSWSAEAADNGNDDGFVRPAPKWTFFCKQLFDSVIALLLLIAAAPLIILAGILIKLTSRGPIIYSQTRTGQFGRPYTIYKLRSMRHRCETESGAVWSLPGDSRVTLVGRLLRKTHIDELPQLWNVLRGDMSLVGPRPERPEFVPGLEKQIPYYTQRLLVKPGITGLAQIQLPPDTDLDSVRRKLAYDLHYINRMGLWLDLRILITTAFKFTCLPTLLCRKALVIPGGTDVERPYTEAASRSGFAAELQPT